MLLWEEIHTIQGLHTDLSWGAQRGLFIHVTEELLHGLDVQHEVPLQTLGGPHVDFAQDVLPGDGVPVQLFHGTPLTTAWAERTGGKKRRRWWWGRRRRWWWWWFSFLTSDVWKTWLQMGIFLRICRKKVRSRRRFHKQGSLHLTLSNPQKEGRNLRCASDLRRWRLSDKGYVHL